MSKARKQVEPLLRKFAELERHKDVDALIAQEHIVLQFEYEEEQNIALRARIVTLESQLEQARALLWVWTDMDPLRYDNEYSACPFCAFDYPNMRHESDCAFVQARVFLGIEGGGSDADS
jgi:hypothetical protein